MTHEPNTTDVVSSFWQKAEAGADANPESGSGPVTFVPAGNLGRRRFLQMMGTALAVPALEACTRQPKEEIVPYVKQPENIIPGKPLFYASAVLLGGYAQGVLVEQHMGRPTKVEGNPDHPASLGGTNGFAQAEILQLYDPDRSSTVRHRGDISSWGELASALQVEMVGRRSVKGKGLCILTGEVTSPTLIEQIDELLQELPEARWYIHEPAGSNADLEGTKAVFGRAYEPLYRFDRADVIVSLDADFLGLEGDPRAVHDWATRRSAASRGEAEMSRLYTVQSAPILTASNADHRITVGAAQVEHIARRIAAGVFQKLGRNDEASAVQNGASEPTGAQAATIAAIVADLTAAGKGAVVVPGKYQPAIVHRLAHAINNALGSEAVAYREPIRASARPGVGTLSDLKKALDEEGVELLVVSGANPLYSAPASLGFEASLKKARVRVHHGLYLDETAAHCQWHVPGSHPFEHWSDARSADGTLTVVQPLIEPLYESKSEHELFAALTNNPDRTGYRIVREAWQKRLGGDMFETGWRKLLHDGFARGSESKPVAVTAVKGEWPAATASAGGFEVIFRPDSGTYDGRFANNGWLQEMPKPLTQLTWDNAVILHERTAKELGLDNGDVVAIEVGGAKVTGAAWIVPGQPQGSATLHLGYGRTRGGKVQRGSGFNAYPILPLDGFHAGGARITATGDRYKLATAQPHSSQEGRDLAKSVSLASFRDNPEQFANHHVQLSLYPEHEYKGYSWGMTIDLSSCIGCSACLLACQAENNVPIVGKEQVIMGREMHWIRIDRYYDDGPDGEPDTRFQPVPCMHCDNAPCEAVCPVAATVHHDEGLNDMVYNRCVGTKDCSANCPYKVRRFNFFGYSTEPIAPLDPTAASLTMMRNPDVTVRSYGVMEKCTYCVQRINAARVDAKRENRDIRDGDVMSACQAACPAKAISFGNLNDPNSQVSRRKAEKRNYEMLPELNNKPRTTYLARIQNPNPGLATKPAKAEGGHG